MQIDNLRKTLWETRIGVPLGEVVLDPEKNEFLAIHYSAWHTFFQINLNPNGIEVRVADPQWLISHVEENPSTLLTQMSQGARILAPTDELRDFIAKYDDLFQSEPRFYKRANIHRKN